MKKTLIITGVILLVLIVVLFTIPLLFTDQVAIMVRNKANENLNARVDFKDVSLNMFENFPNLTLNIDNLLITNKAPFENDTLVSINQFEASVSLWSLIRGKQIIVNKVKLLKPNIFVYVLADSTANYNIVKETGAKKIDTSKGQTELNLALKEYSIEDGNIAYVDQTSDIAVAVKGLNHRGSGDFSKGVFMLDTKTDINSLNVQMNNIKYLRNVNTKLDMTLDANLNDKKFVLKENELRLNNLIMKFNGFFAMQKDSSINIDLIFGTKGTNFKDLISLIPTVYSRKFNDLKSSGKLALSGHVKGLYNKKVIPAFNIQLNVDNGNFQYPDLPTPVNNVNVDLNVNNPGGTADNTVINMKKFHMEIGKEPLDAKLLVKTPQSIPYIETTVKGHVNLGNLKNALAIEKITKLSGVIDADLQAKGNISKVKRNLAENITAAGKVSASNIIYSDKEMPQEVQVRQALLTFNTKQVNLSGLNMQLGKSDLRADGTLSNMFSYILSDGTLSGSLKIASNYFDVNPLMTKKKEQSNVKTDTGKISSVELPEKLNFTMNSSFGTLIYDNLTIQNVKGIITLSNRRLNLNSLSMNMLGGKVIASGYYYTPPAQPPQVSFNLNLDNLSIRNSYDSFVSIKQFAPMAKNIFGNYSAKLNLNSILDKNMKPVWNTFNSKGTLNIKNAEVKDLQPLNAVADKLKITELKNPKLNNINPSFTIANGRFNISPFNFKVAGYDLTVSGSNGIDNTLDYVMGVDIPAAKFKSQVNQKVSDLLGSKVDLVGSNKIRIDVGIKGTFNNPSISTSAGDIVNTAKQQVKEEVKQQVTNEVKKQVEQKTDTLKKQLKKEAEDKLKDIFKKKF